MNEKTLRALVEAGAVKRALLVASGAFIHIEVTTLTGKITASTNQGSIKTWKTLDAAARWTRSLGIGKAQIDMQHWLPDQKGLNLN